MTIYFKNNHKGQKNVGPTQQIHLSLLYYQLILFLVQFSTFYFYTNKSYKINSTINMTFLESQKKTLIFRNLAIRIKN